MHSIDPTSIDDMMFFLRSSAVVSRLKVEFNYATPCDICFPCTQRDPHPHARFAFCVHLNIWNSWIVENNFQLRHVFRIGSNDMFGVSTMINRRSLMMITDHYYRRRPTRGIVHSILSSQSIRMELSQLIPLTIDHFIMFVSSRSTLSVRGMMTNRQIRSL